MNFAPLSAFRPAHRRPGLPVWIALRIIGTLGTMAGGTAAAATVLTDIQITGASNSIAAGATLTVAGTGEVYAAPGSVLDFKWATLALPESLQLKNLKLEGASLQVLADGVLTFNSGSSLVAASGSSVDLSAANVTFPSSVVLTSATQTLAGKTFASPTFTGTVATGDKDVVFSLTAPSTGDVNYYAPLQWGTGSRYSLSGGRSIFNSVDDNVGGINYNPTLVPGDVAYSIAFESKFYNPPQGVDTEFYYSWNGPVGVNPESGGRSSRRIFQTNVSWGTAAGAPATKPMGYTQWSFDVNKFFVDNGANYNGAFLLDFTTSPQPLMTWHGAFNLEYGLTLGGAINQSDNTSSNQLRGATLLSAGNAYYSFAAGNNALLTLANSTGDTGLRLQRGESSSEYMVVGGGAGGGLFGGASNAHYFDSVTNGGSVGSLRDFAFRASFNGGSSYTSALLIQPRNGLVQIPFTTASTSTGTGALVVSGGIGAAGRLNAGEVYTAGAIRSYAEETSAFAQLANGYASPSLTLNSNAAGNFRTIDFSYGSPATRLWRVGYAGFNSSTYLNFESGTGMALSLAANGDATFYSTTSATSTSSGALVVAGGLGLGGNLHVGGSVVQAGGGTFSGTSGALALSAAGTNQNVTLTPSGSGSVLVKGPLTATGRITAGEVLSNGALRSSDAGSNAFAELHNNGTNPSLTLNSNAAGNFRTIDFSYGSPATRLWRVGYAGFNSSTYLNFESGTGMALSLAANGDATFYSTTSATSTSSGALVVAGGLGLGGNLHVGGSVVQAGGGTFSGTSGALALSAAGTNQNVTLTPSGSGSVLVKGPLTATGRLSTTATTASTSPSTGALVVAGGFGLTGDMFIGGTISFADGGQLAKSASTLSLSAGGTDRSITLTPTGTGSVIAAGPFVVAGNHTVNSTSAATSTATGAFTVAGGVGIQKKLFLGDDLSLIPRSSEASSIRLSGTAVTDTPGLWFRDGGTPTAANVALAGTTSATILNAPTGGSVSLRVGDTGYVTVAPSAMTLWSIPLKVTSSTASISTTTGSATFAGGIGVEGRTTTKTLSVGGGSAVDLILTVLASLDFPSIAPNGGVQDLTVSVPGASLADAVNVVEGGGAFAPSGLVLRGIVTAADTVTVRATNVTTAAIDPPTLPFRVTIISF